MKKTCVRLRMYYVVEKQIGEKLGASGDTLRNAKW